ncbi:transcription regulator [Companilactobacillus nodensis DSM 19682 = JCM 14932 = NBRC 107160]|uniref:Transcription regulator n=2 Tax=Companilactobacillus nodensis TaxID=460870 RepID=A0A0R1K9B4_9LACO|nr:transcription regulator [Companilactobacillus nodensis DSM 19682 = JCM 14932 = NBRC 107160]
MYTGGARMLDNYLLEELVVFSKTGTLALAAEQLHVTQPTVTRGMKKLESELGTHLFDRQPNRITLTETGKLAVKEAEKLISANKEAIERIQNFDRSQRVMRFGSTLPGPIIVLNYLKKDLPGNIKIKENQLKPDSITTRLNRGEYTLILSNQNLSSTTIESQYIGIEQLAINLNKSMEQANQPTTKFANLKDLSFLVPANVGLWRNIIQQSIPNAKFFYQEQHSALSEIIKYADFPYFTTNVSPLDTVGDAPVRNGSISQIPIIDGNAKMNIYVNYLSVEKNRVKNIIDQLLSVWPDDFSH